MSDQVSNLVGPGEPRFGAAPAWQNAKAPLSDLFANVLDKANFAEQMIGASQFGLMRVAERVTEGHHDRFDDERNRAPAEPAKESAAPAEHSAKREDAAGEEADDDAAHGEDADAPRRSAAAAPAAPMTLAPAQSRKGDKPGLSVQPNAASGVTLQAKGDGASAGDRRALITGAADPAAAQSADKGTAAQTARTHGKPAFDGALAKANGQPAAAGQMKADAGAPATGSEKSLAARTGAGAPAQTPNAAAETFAALSDEHTQLIRAGAKRAAELHNMKIRLFAHRDAIGKAEGQTSANHGANPPATAGANAVKPTIDVTVPATPPAPAANAGPAARPAGLFDGSAAGSLPGQTGLKIAIGALSGEGPSNGIEHAAALAERHAASNAAPRGAALGLRPTASQLAYQPAEQIKVHIQQMVKSGAEHIQVRLSPAALGRVEVALEVSHDKAVHAIVYAEKPETLDMLERDARVLREAFEQAGLKFDTNGLTFRHGHADNPGAGLGNGAAPPAGPAAADPDDGDAEAGLDAAPPRRRQHDGVLDLEI